MVSNARSFERVFMHLCTSSKRPVHAVEKLTQNQAGLWLTGLLVKRLTDGKIETLYQKEGLSGYIITQTSLESCIVEFVEKLTQNQAGLWLTGLLVKRLTDGKIETLYQKEGLSGYIITQTSLESCIDDTCSS
ncbi:hypothetical protein HID58_032528 [Brassica napus]|uniref:Uncharacterized protein n=1 Tax=Brassica napus TaxID=3708 RepID=A0ABQ8BWL7_BRANA|nr:hypothetical protein HID58_032528 [Brassica napus]